MVAGFFASNNFLIGMVTAVEANYCAILLHGVETMKLAQQRLVLVSKQIYPADTAEETLANFSDAMQQCALQLNPALIRTTLLEENADHTLTEIMSICRIHDQDVCRFALYLMLREHPEWFHQKQGSYHTNTDAQVQEYIQKELWQEQHNLDLQASPLLAKKGLPVLFTPELIRTAEAIKPYCHTSDRSDSTKLECWTIDAPVSQDLDDAISIHKAAQGWEIGIHIADVDWYVEAGSPLDTEARRRTSSAYLPDRDVHMLPPSLSCDKASLLSIGIRPALSVFISCDAAGNQLSHHICLTSICISRRFSYDEIETLLNQTSTPRQNDPTERIKALFMITENHLQQRIKAGAYIPQQNLLTPARRLVAECMVICNSLLAALAKERQAPLFFRYLDESALPERRENQAETSFPPSVMGTSPQPHQAMGLSCYAQASSPLRRYSDLVNQRQIKSLLQGTALPYTKSELDDMLEHLEQTRQRLRQVTLQAESLVKKPV